MNKGENTMQLASLAVKEDQEAGFAVDVTHPVTGISIGITVTVCGIDSGTFKQILRKQINRRNEQLAKSRDKKKFVTAEQVEEENMEMLIACTKAWHTGDRPEIEFNAGEWLPCTPENIRRIYIELPWLKEQINDEIGDRNHFLGK